MEIVRGPFVHLFVVSLRLQHQGARQAHHPGPARAALALYGRHCPGQRHESIGHRRHWTAFVRVALTLLFLVVAVGSIIGLVLLFFLYGIYLSLIFMKKWSININLGKSE